MPLSIEKRLRIIELYESAAENNKINELALRKFVEKWQNFGNN